MARYAGRGVDHHVVRHLGSRIVGGRHAEGAAPDLPAPCGELDLAVAGWHVLRDPATSATGDR